jgi:hypothetical protein
MKMEILRPIFHLLAFGVCTGSVIFVSLCVLEALKIKDNIRWLLGMGILSSTQIILALELLSLTHSIGLRGLLLIHASTMLILWLSGFRCDVSIIYKVLSRLIRRAFEVSDRLLLVLLLVVFLSGLVNLCLVLAIPPNNFDSMTYHMARVGYYLQQHSFDAFSTPNLRQTLFPANAEILILWNAVLLKSDQTAGLIQWLCWCGTILAVYALARAVVPSRSPRSWLFAALAFAVFPQVLLQSSSTQNDLATAFFVSCAFIFATEAAVLESRFGAIVLSAAAMGLALGTKPQAILVLPGYGLLLLVGLLKRKPIVWKHTMAMALGCVIGFMALGSYFYIQNLHAHASPIGPPSMTAVGSLDHLELPVIWSNLGRYVVQFLSPGGSVPVTGELQAKLTEYYQLLADTAFRWFRIQANIPGKDFLGAKWEQFLPSAIHEDLSWFGPIWGFIGLPILLLVMVLPARQSQASPEARVLALSAIFYLVLTSVALRWNPYFGRYMVLMVALGSPLLCFLYRERAKRSFSIANSLLVGICIVTASSACLYNGMKPLAGPRTIFGQDRVSMLTWGKPSIESWVRIVDRMGLGSSTLGLVVPNENEFDYAFFGRHFERKVISIRLDREKLMDVRKLPKVDYLLFISESQRYFLEEGSEFPINAVIGNADLRPLLARTRAPGSGWHAVLDIDGVGHLFLRAGMSLDPSVLLGLPEYLLGPTRWDDGWVGGEFTAHVRVDPAKPSLLIRGEMPDFGIKPILQLLAPDGTILKTYKLPGPGPFNLALPLESLASSYSNSYAAIKFLSNISFNPKKMGQSNDDRQLSWKLLDLKLGNAAASKPALQDYRPTFTWYSDKWVQRRITVPVRRDPLLPFLQIRGDMPFLTNKSELKLFFKGTLLDQFHPSDSNAFTQTVSLKPAIAACKSEYCAIVFDANESFNPKLAGQSSDDRDLSWRLYELKLIGAPKATR